MIIELSTHHVLVVRCASKLELFSNAKRYLPIVFFDLRALCGGSVVLFLYVCIDTIHHTLHTNNKDTPTGSFERIF